MTGRITHIPQQEHPCGPPTPTAGLPTMTTWQCDTCGDDWLLIPPATLSPDQLTPSPEWWIRSPGQFESGYRRRTAWWSRVVGAWQRITTKSSVETSKDGEA